MKDGAPTKALEGFARGAGAKIEDLTIVHDGKQDVTPTNISKPANRWANFWKTLSIAVKKPPIPKVMRWGSTFTFVRPVHGLIVAARRRHRERQRFGSAKWQSNLGTRFLSNGEITITNADSYATQMREQCKVVASFAERKPRFRRLWNEQAGRLESRSRR